uniref:Glucose-methanol-choline oxidoreductase N-terminal domain-containing protein n=1 Tax=Strigamia maritima TaxID=126957 RepID=T1ILS9_STRMM
MRLIPYSLGNNDMPSDSPLSGMPFFPREYGMRLCFHVNWSYTVLYRSVSRNCPMSKNKILPQDFVNGLLEYFSVSRYVDITRLSNSKFQTRSFDPFISNNLQFSLCIVGGGSAGAVVANRLSEDPMAEVLLIEAGGDETIFSEIPALAGYLQLSDLDWQYKTTPQQAGCWGMVNRQCLWPRGKVLGGSSTINYMLYVRGNKNDYDAWARLGNTGWAYKDVLPYFLKSEDFSSSLTRSGNEPYHRKGGYLSVNEAPWHTPLARAFVKSGETIGYQETDINGARQTGFTIAPGTLRKGARCSTAKAFIRPANSRKNLYVSLKSHATKILFDKNKRAVGVVYHKDGEERIARARREVILSAGATNSPQLLMLSGVGPRQHLEELQIPIIADLPGVGGNMQDHIGAGIVFTVEKPVSVVQSRYENSYYVGQWALFGKGPLTVLGGIEGLAFINTRYANKSMDWPDIQYHFVSGSPAADSGRQIRRMMGFSDKFWNGYFEPISGKDSFMFSTTLLRPRSNGTVRLQSKNPFDPPLLDPKYLTDQQDVNVMVDGIKIAIALGLSEPFQKYGVKLHDTLFPTCLHEKPYSDGYWGCVARTYTATIYHPVGTCKMGRSWDPLAVVDPHLRVYGVKNLRVIDASIMPLIVSGNTNAPSIMIGERGSDLVKEYWTKR